MSSPDFEVMIGRNVKKATFNVHLIRFQDGNMQHSGDTALRWHCCILSAFSLQTHAAFFGSTRLVWNTAIIENMKKILFINIFRSVHHKIWFRQMPGGGSEFHHVLVLCRV